MKAYKISLVILKRVLDFGIVAYLLMIPIILITAGFELNISGTTIKATHLYTPIKILIPLILTRLVITIKFKDFVLLLSSIILSLCVAEIVIRLWNPSLSRPQMLQIHRASPIFGWELVPRSFGIGGAGESYNINSAGFRDTEHKLKKQPGVYRIMVIGDSFTFGPSVNLEDTYPKQLERTLNHASTTYEVINCGVIGHNMWQHYEMLKRKVLSYQPDLVILGLFMDDITASVPPYRDTIDWQATNPFERDSSGIMGHSSLWNLLRNWNYLLESKYRYCRGYRYLEGIERRKEELANPSNSFHRVMYGKMEKQIYTEFSESLKKFVLTSKSAGTSVLVIMIPDAAQLHNPDGQAVNRFVYQACHEADVPFIDITARFEKEKNLKSLYMFPLDPHTSPKGLRLIAESIADQMKRLGLLMS